MPNSISQGNVMYQHAAQEYTQTGYTVIQGLLSPHEVNELIAHYMQMNAARRAQEVDDPNTIDNALDPLKRYHVF
jgi:hypothetical protein